MVALRWRSIFVGSSTFCRGATSDGSRGFQPTDANDTRKGCRGATIESGAMTRIQLTIGGVAMVQSSLRDDICVRDW